MSTIDVRTVQSERRSHGATGCNRLMARLRHLFNWSIAEGMIDHTPFKRGDVTLVKLDTHAERERTRRLNPIWSSHRLITAVRGGLTSPTTSADNLSAVVTCTTDC